MPRADGERAGDKPSTAEAATPSDDRRHRLQSPHFGGMGADVAREAEEHRMAEREQVDVADQEVERAGEQREAERSA